MLNPIKTTDTLHLIRCNVGGETYGLDMAWVRTVERMDRLLIDSEMTMDEAGFVGWLPSSRGDIPVFSLARRLGRQPSSMEITAQQRIIVLPSPIPFTRGRVEEGRPWALLVDRVSQVIQISGDCFQPLPRITVNPTANYFEGVIRMEESLILFLSPEWLHPDATVAETPPQTFQAQTTQDFTKNGLTKTKEVKRRQNGWANPKSGRIMLFSTTKADSDDQPLSYGLSITQVSEVLRPLPLIPVPAAPSFVVGLVNWRKHPVPIIDLDSRLGLEYDPNKKSNRKSRLMIARGTNQNTLVGFFIRPDVQTLQLPIAHRPITRTLAVAPSLVKGMVELEDETLIVPNIPAILGEE